jgi:hypothetical protein
VAFPGSVEPPPLESPVPGELLSLGLTPVLDDELDCAKTAPELPTSKAAAMLYAVIQLRIVCPSIAIGPLCSQRGNTVLTIEGTKIPETDNRIEKYSEPLAGAFAKLTYVRE